MPAATCFSIRSLLHPTSEEIQALSELLIDCVEGGASVSFMLPLSIERAQQFWLGVATEVARGARILLVAEEAGVIVGTVQLILEQPENQPHRADLAKMLVRRSTRRRGLGALLMQTAETAALECAKSLLVLDTASNDAERLYDRLGWQRVGSIPGYALLPSGGLCDTIVFYRQLQLSAPAPNSPPEAMPGAYHTTHGR